MSLDVELAPQPVLEVDIEAAVESTVVEVIAPGGPPGPPGPQGPPGQWEQLTQAAYDALDPPDPETLYVIIG